MNHLERKAIQSELQHLLYVEFRFAQSQLFEILKEVAQYYKPSSELASGDGANNPSPSLTSPQGLGSQTLHITHKSGNPSSGKQGKFPPTDKFASSAAPSRWFASSSHSWMDVSLHLDGYLIRHAEISLKLYKHHKFLLARKSTFGSTSGSHGCFSTNVRQPKYPLVLHQLLQCYNTMVKELNRLEEYRMADSNRTEEETSVSEALACINSTMEVLAQVHDLICLPCQEVFPQKLNLPCDKANSPPHFQPELPDDLIIEASVYRDELIISAFGLHTMHRRPKHEGVLDNIWLDGDGTGADLAGKQFVFPGKYVEVVDMAQVRFTVHSLALALDKIYEAQDIAKRMQKKLLAHAQVETMIASQMQQQREQENEQVETFDLSGENDSHHRRDDLLQPDPNQNIADWLF